MLSCDYFIVQWDTYHRYDELTRILKEYAAAYPHLLALESIGKSYEGRDVWLATVTNFSTGSAREKPALWVDGNIHASRTGRFLGLPVLCAHAHRRIWL